PQVQLVQYALLNDKLLIWVVTKNRVQVQDVAISLPTLTEQIKQYCNLVVRPAAQSSPALREAAQALYKLLIQPIAAALDQEKIVCLVPDKALHYLPFQALVVPTTGQYLIEQYTLMYAASAST